MHNYDSHWNGNQFGNPNSYAAVSQVEFNDGHIWPSRHGYDTANIGIPPLPQPYYHGGYQDQDGFDPSTMHQAQTSLGLNANASSYTSSGGYQDGLGSPRVGHQPQQSLTPNPFDLSNAESFSNTDKVTLQMMGDGSDPTENSPPSYEPYQTAAGADTITR